MLSYRHGFHAGNPADVLKHSVLLQLIISMQQKEKGFCYFDTHAAASVYHLNSEFAQKNREYEYGAAYFFQLDPQQLNHEALRHYQQFLVEFNTLYQQLVNTQDQTLSSELIYYPGSPAIAIKQLREQDESILCELHTQEIKQLKHHCNKLKTLTKGSIAVHHRSGYEAMAALLPPAQKRGLVFIDPSYETRDENRELQSALKKALARFSHGVYVIWYPVIENVNPIASLMQERWIKELNTLDIRIQIPEAARYGRMNATGLFIINPPWHASNCLKGLNKAIEELLEKVK